MTNPNTESAAVQKPLPIGETDAKPEDKEEDDFLKGSCAYGGPTESCESCS